MILDFDGTVCLGDGPVLAYADADAEQFPDAPPLAAMADFSLVVGMGDLSFREEIMVSSRIPQPILLEGLIAALTEELGPKVAAAKALALEIISGNLDE